MDTSSCAHRGWGRFSVRGCGHGRMCAWGEVLVLAIAGPVADLIGIRNIFIICGAAFLATVLLFLFSKPLLNIEKEKPAEAESQPSQANPVIG